MAFERGQDYYFITAEEYTDAIEAGIDLSQFFDGGDGCYYILASEYDDEEALLDDIGILASFMTYTYSTTGTGGM